MLSKASIGISLLGHGERCSGTYPNEPSSNGLGKYAPTGDCSRSVRKHISTMIQRPIESKTNADAVMVIGLVPRFYLGAIFAIAAYGKIVSPHGYVLAVRSFLLGPALGNAPQWYASFVSTTVLPHISTVATLAVGAEVCIAVSLLLGLFTRLGAAIAIYLLINYMFAKGSTVWNPASNDAADIMLAFVVVMSGPGRIFGIDKFLTR